MNRAREMNTGTMMITAVTPSGGTRAAMLRACASTAPALRKHRDPAGGASRNLDRITLRGITEQNGDDPVAADDQQAHRPDGIAAHMSLQFQYP